MDDMPPVRLYRAPSLMGSPAAAGATKAREKTNSVSSNNPFFNMANLLFFRLMKGNDFFTKLATDTHGNTQKWA